MSVVQVQVAVVCATLSSLSILAIMKPTVFAFIVSRMPVVGPILTTECATCGQPELTMRAEEMPVDFPTEDPMDAVTVKFCESCSRTMTTQTRLQMLAGFRGESCDE